MVLNLYSEPSKTKSCVIMLFDVVQRVMQTTYCYYSNIAEFYRFQKTNSVLSALIPDVLVFLYINFVEHAIVTFASNVGLHLHRDVPRKHRQKQPLLHRKIFWHVYTPKYGEKKKKKTNFFPLRTYLLLIDFLRGKSRLDTLPGFQKRLSLRHLVRVMHHHAGHVRARQQQQINATLKFVNV